MSLPPAFVALLKPAPLRLVEQVAQRAFERVLTRHPRIFERLGDHAVQTFCFAPTDIPFEFAVSPRTRRVRAMRSGRIMRWDAKITGPIVLLLALAEGRADGDAEFFGRQLTVDGDMEAVVALRNALENDAVDFTEDLAPAGAPFHRPVARLLAHVRVKLLAGEDRGWN
jgi:O2-independent ubiquinone biosynthesis accessory factor UbiT